MRPGGFFQLRVAGARPGRVPFEEREMSEQLIWLFSPEMLLGWAVVLGLAAVLYDQEHHGGEQ